MSEAFQPTLEYDGATVKPVVPDGTRIAEISFLPSSRRSVTAVTVTSEVMSVPELVMNAFDPLITQPSASSFAVVRVAPASEPPPASVRPNAPSFLPAARSGSQRSFWASVPNRSSGMIPSDTPASSVIATDWSTRPSSSRATHRAT